jgi:hypothetical protein
LKCRLATVLIVQLFADWMAPVVKRLRLYGPPAVTQRAPFGAMAGLSTRASGGMRGSFYEPRRAAFGRTWIRGFLKRQALGAKEKAHDDGR